MLPVDSELSLAELNEHLVSDPAKPDAIPYATSYYKPFWGFCVTHHQREGLRDQRYRVVIDSQLKPGSLTYGDIVIPGESEKEIFFSTYTCHPAMANNEISGPVLATFLARWVTSRSNGYTYRFVFAPETIGAIVYLSRHLGHLREKTFAAFNLTCVGDENAVSFLPSRSGDSIADQAALHVLKHKAPGFKFYDFLKHRGSDERQYCSPGVELPMVSIMGSKYGTYSEYHTSKDDLSFISPQGLERAFELHKECIHLLVVNRIYRSRIIGEPHLARQGWIVNRLADVRLVKTGG